MSLFLFAIYVVEKLAEQLQRKITWYEGNLSGSAKYGAWYLVFQHCWGSTKPQQVQTRMGKSYEAEPPKLLTILFP